ncbi:histidine protein methyltransferase 1 homolog [Procambarus clarkii]|uniref:histidine protein methyltransferase 1 homolog n=1 Tax=Procambarus clarkii TaxID=6728 RepID=UPI001E672ABF|nr:histidine protein methyltransferase 1 homolog [Procambarus clarkii]XP_045619314.1 histidine protein methyltransferase 1 homolog [Procambarus clarkii]
MFKFNFNVEPKDKIESSVSPEPVSDSEQWLPAQKHEVNSTHFQSLSEDTIVEEVTIGQTKIRYLSMTAAMQKMEEKELSSYILPAFKDHTDLVPAIYEGGLKVWECTWDLLHFLEASDIKLKRRRVLELGCGAALPALYTALQGAHVTLQDYNEEVVNFITIPNVALNLANYSFVDNGNILTEDISASQETVTEIQSKASFYSGDWGELDKLLLNIRNNEQYSKDNLNSDKSKTTMQNYEECQEFKFDIILTSETIYNPECHQRLLTLMTNCLKQDGVILLAAKSYYFGVGGGTLQFADVVKSQGKLDILTHITNNEGVKREILEMKFKNVQ